jgi:hypothetical protein
MATEPRDEVPAVKDNLHSDREAGMDQRGGNESRDVGNDPSQAAQESATAAESLKAQVEKEDKEQQAKRPKTGEELGVEVRHPSDGAESEVIPGH